jgi:hypothetical protein
VTNVRKECLIANIEMRVLTFWATQRDNFAGHVGQGLLSHEILYVILVELHAINANRRERFVDGNLSWRTESVDVQTLLFGPLCGPDQRRIACPSLNAAGIVGLGNLQWPIRPDRSYVRNRQDRRRA